MEKITIDGVTYEVEPQVAQAVTKQAERSDAKIVEIKESVGKQTARADAAEESLVAEKKARTDAEDPKAIDKLVRARVDLETQAAAILGEESELNLDEMTEDQIKSAIVLHLAPDAEKAKANLDAHDGVYLQARFDSALESFDPDNQPNAGLALSRIATRNAGGSRADAAAKRDEMRERNIKAGLDPLPSSIA